MSEINVNWQDLVHYNKVEVIYELILPLPWLALSFYSSNQGYYILTLFSSFYYFLTALRLSHNAFHYALGLPRWVTDIVMLLQSTLMLGSLHAVQYAHLNHHKHCMTEADVEGNVAKMKWWTVLLRGPEFPFSIHLFSIKNAPRHKRIWIYTELVLNVIVITYAFFISDSIAIQLHVALMMTGYSLSAFFAVWLVHRNHDSSEHHANNRSVCSRTLRGKYKNLIFYNMFFHFEHHLYPAVPTCHLDELSKRIDQSGKIKHEWVF